MTFLSTPLMQIVFPISKKFCKCALASSCAFPLNCVACTKLMRLDYIKDMLKKFGMQDAKSISTPVGTNESLLVATW